MIGLAEAGVVERRTTSSGFLAPALQLGQRLA
jgi:hypothetical protein